MSFFNSITLENEPPDNGPNKNLLIYISNWYLKPNEDNYKKVVRELMEGNALLLLPSVNKPGENNNWQTADENTMVTLSSVSVIDGQKILAAFTDEQALLNTTDQYSSYMEMRSDDVLLLCERNTIGRVVINSNSYNMLF